MKANVSQTLAKGRSLIVCDEWAGITEDKIPPGCRYVLLSHNAPGVREVAGAHGTLWDTDGYVHERAPSIVLPSQEDK